MRNTSVVRANLVSNISTVRTVLGTISRPIPLFPDLKLRPRLFGFKSRVGAAAEAVGRHALTQLAMNAVDGPRGLGPDLMLREFLPERFGG
jgi:hypothetical protein